MIIGRFYYRLESKGRLALPSPFRNQLKNAIITRGLERCLFIFPPKTWQQLINKLQNSPLTSSQIRGFTRLISHDAASVALDQQGRTRIPDYLIAYAGLKKEVVIAGSLNRVEIWDKVKYHRYIAEIEPEFAKLADQLSELNI